MCTLPFTYTKRTGSQAEDKRVVNQLTFVPALTHSGIPKMHFILSFSHSSAFSLSFSFLLFSHHRFAFLIFYFTSLHFVLYDGKTDRQKDRQQAERYRQSKATISDTHIVGDLFLSQKHFNFIKGRESILICIWVHSIYSAHMFIALESPFLIPWLIKSQEGNAAAGRGENSFADLASGASVKHSIRLARRTQQGDLGAFYPLDFKAQTRHVKLKAQVSKTPALAQEEALVRRSILQLPVCTLRGLIWGNPENIIRCLISSSAFKYIVIQFRSKPHLNTVLKST